MRTYVKFKTTFIPGLSVKQEKYCKAMARLRIISHSLAIEKGKYTTPPFPIENRTCKNCLGDIEYEYHFLTEYKAFCIDRKNLYTGIEDKCYQFTSLDDKGKFVYMLSACADIAELIAKFTYDFLP